jgi:DNA-binding NtrC family response regulator
MKARVLIVDDDESLRRALRDRFEHWGHAPSEAATGAEALERLAERQFDLVVLDLSLPDRSGLEVLKQIREEGHPADVVLLTAHGSIEAAVEALRAGAVDFLQKPADFELLQAFVGRALENRRLRLAHRVLAEEVAQSGPDFVWKSPIMTALVETATRAAQSNATVLLTGESGTGKQVVARHLHDQSPRREGPFVYVNCVALADTLVESTLFGHERGAFTDARTQKQGFLELAHGGTAFLDEIGDISAGAQTKLLHFLETGEFERVGGTRTLSVDCRIVTATNRDLEKAIQDGRFREDLYYRLNVIRLHIPALRERREDIPLLAESFLTHFAQDLKRGPLRFASETMAVLTRAPWPGNVRQLKNAVERMAVLATEDVLTPDLLPPEIASGAGGGAGEIAGLPMREAMRAFKRQYIAKALAETGGNQTKAAERLGLQRTFLNRLIKELGVS